MSAGIEGLQRLAVGADQLDRPDIGSFDANSWDKGTLSGQFMPAHYLARPLIPEEAAGQAARPSSPCKVAASCSCLISASRTRLYLTGPASISRSTGGAEFF